MNGKISPGMGRDLVKALFIGFGNMGRPLLKPFIEAFCNLGINLNLYLLDLQASEAEISRLLTHNSAEKNGRLEINLCRTIPDERYDYVFLAVKPQIYRSNFAKMTLSHDCTVFSCMAGISTDILCEDLGVANVLRCMPNLAIQNGDGFVGYFRCQARSEVVNEFITALNKISTCLEVQNEELLNNITALMGSGPALVATFIEACVRFAVSCGFTRVDAEVMTKNLVRSTLTLLREQSPEELCAKVASKGGTTEAMLQRAEDEHLIDVVNECFEVALRRARDLSSCKDEAPI